MTAEQVQSTARALVAPGKGLLAADESLPTIEKRFATIGVRSTEDTRRAYREMLFSTHGINEFISGVILFDETLRQRASNGTSFVEVLKNQNIIPGIKVDKGAKRLAGFPNERITEGLDGLRERLAEYAELGARFTKWRAVIKIGHDFPTLAAMKANAHALARFAALSQEAGLVPIVEPEVLMDGDHTLDRHREISETMIKLTFEALSDFRVQLEGMLLKPNMVLPGTESNDRASRRRNGPLPVAFRPAGGSRNCFSFRRPKRRPCDRTLERHQRTRSRSLAVELLLWPCIARCRDENLARPKRKHRSRSTRLLPPRPLQLRRALQPLHRGNGTQRAPPTSRAINLYRKNVVTSAPT
jgi:fructose-bisphosphate aldolase class 1